MWDFYLGDSGDLLTGFSNDSIENSFWPSLIMDQRGWGLTPVRRFRSNVGSKDDGGVNYGNGGRHGKAGIETPSTRRIW